MPDYAWFDVTSLHDGITVIWEPLGGEDLRSFLIEGERDVAVLDTGSGVGDFAGLVRSLSDKDPLVLHSHSHWDHIGDSYRFAPIYIHPAEQDQLREGVPNRAFKLSFPPDYDPGRPYPSDFDLETRDIPGVEPTGYLNHGDRFDLGGRVLEIFHTPGHSPGGISILDRTGRALFAGDALTLFNHYLFLPHSDPGVFRETLKLLVGLADQVDEIHVSHGPMLTPADVHAIRDAYEEIWSGARQPDQTEQMDVGFDAPIQTDIFKYERFGFLLAAGKYGAGASLID